MMMGPLLPLIVVAEYSEETEDDSASGEMCFYGDPIHFLAFGAKRCGGSWFILSLSFYIFVYGTCNTYCDLWHVMNYLSTICDVVF
jgi:hypothetical protein